MKSKQTDTHIVIIGSGIAGMSCALYAEALGLGPILLISKNTLEESNTAYAQGGIAGVLAPHDHPAKHALDTLRAGAGACDQQAVRRLCLESTGALQWLIDQGVPFDTAHGTWAFTREAAHSCARILHANGDQTGLAIVRTLSQKIQQTQIRCLSHAMLTNIITDTGRVVGIQLLHNQRICNVSCDHVIIATGGAGQVYAKTTNPLIATGDGVACAFRAGAAIADAEYMQFHPTVLALPNVQPFLISEAVRGEGAVLRDAQGTPFMQMYHPLADLAPRDIVARAIAQTITHQQGQPVYLDATHLGRSSRTRFPTISAHLHAHGLALETDYIPVTPAAHYWMGGIATDTWGRSSLDGLYAIGEAACTGVHGANRLASNSLLEGVVFAHRVINCISQPIHSPWPKNFQSDIFPAPDLENRHSDLQFTRSALQTLMWDSAGLLREENMLQKAISHICLWQSAHTYPKIFDSVAAIENANLLLVAGLICQAALRRTASRGAHWRLDYPAETHVDTSHKRLAWVASPAYLQQTHADFDAKELQHVTLSA